MGRFINADAYTSTGQGVLGNNMFAYCGNNPINYEDPFGYYRFDIYEVCLGGTSSNISPNYGYGAAKPYIESDDMEFNCLAYALGETEWRNINGFDKTMTDVYEVANLLFIDLQNSGYSLRRIQSSSSAIYDDEVRIAMRIGNGDYHFMVQHSDGSWSHKPGFCKTRLIDGANPSTVSWDAPLVDGNLLRMFNIVKEVGVAPNYYDSITIYFAVSK